MIAIATITAIGFANSLRVMICSMNVLMPSNAISTNIIFICCLSFARCGLDVSTVNVSARTFKCVAGYLYLIVTIV